MQIYITVASNPPLQTPNKITPQITIHKKSLVYTRLFYIYRQKEALASSSARYSPHSQNAQCQQS